MKIAAILFLFINATFAWSCRQPENKLSQLLPGSNAYLQELARQIIAKPKDFKYTLNKYHQENGKEYLSVNISGAGIDTQADVLVNNWNKLSGIKRTQGAGYRGAELKGLVLVSDGSDLVYKDLVAVVD